MISRYILLIAVVALIALGAVVTLKFVGPLLAAQRAQTVAAKQEAQIATDTTRIIEKTFTTERTVMQQAEAKADVIQAAPGADTPIPPDVLSSWHSGLRASPTPSNNTNP